MKFAVIIITNCILLTSPAYGTDVSVRGYCDDSFFSVGLFDDTASDKKRDVSCDEMQLTRLGQNQTRISFRRNGSLEAELIGSMREGKLFVQSIQILPRDVADKARGQCEMLKSKNPNDEAFAMYCLAYKDDENVDIKVELNILFRSKDR